MADDGHIRFDPWPWKVYKLIVSSLQMCVLNPRTICLGLFRLPLPRSIASRWLAQGPCQKPLMSLWLKSCCSCIKLTYRSATISHMPRNLICHNMSNIVIWLRLKNHNLYNMSFSKFFIYDLIHEMWNKCLNTSTLSSLNFQVIVPANAFMMHAPIWPIATKLCASRCHRHSSPQRPIRTKYSLNLLTRLIPQSPQCGSPQSKQLIATVMKPEARLLSYKNLPMTPIPIRFQTTKPPKGSNWVSSLFQMANLYQWGTLQIPIKIGLYLPPTEAFRQNQ